MDSAAVLRRSLGFLAPFLLLATSACATLDHRSACLSSATLFKDSAVWEPGQAWHVASRRPRAVRYRGVIYLQGAPYKVVFEEDSSTSDLNVFYLAVAPIRDAWVDARRRQPADSWEERLRRRLREHLAKGLVEDTDWLFSYGASRPELHKSVTVKLPWRHERRPSAETEASEDLRQAWFLPRGEIALGVFPMRSESEPAGAGSATRDGSVFFGMRLDEATQGKAVGLAEWVLVVSLVFDEDIGDRDRIPRALPIGR